MARLQVFIALGCLGCERAREMARHADQRFPSLEVEVVELDGSGPLPPSVVATPTYLLDGSVISFGNPRPARLAELIEQRLGREAQQDRG